MGIRDWETRNRKINMVSSWLLTDETLNLKPDTVSCEIVLKRFEGSKVLSQDHISSILSDYVRRLRTFSNLWLLAIWFSLKGNTVKLRYRGTFPNTACLDRLEKLLKVLRLLTYSGKV